FRRISASASLGGWRKAWFLPACRPSAEFSQNQRLSFVGRLAKSVVFASVPTLRGIFAESAPQLRWAAGEKRGFCQRAGPPRNFRRISASASLSGWQKAWFLPACRPSAEFSQNQRLSFGGGLAKSGVFAPRPTPPGASAPPPPRDESRK